MQVMLCLHVALTMDVLTQLLNSLPIFSSCLFDFLWVCGRFYVSETFYSNDYKPITKQKTSSNVNSFSDTELAL